MEEDITAAIAITDLASRNGPRDAAELETVWLILLASYANARRPSEPARERME